LEQVSEAIPVIKSLRGLYSKFNQLAVSGKHGQRQGRERGHELMFGSFMKPVVVGNHGPVKDLKQEAKTDADITMLDASDAAEWEESEASEI
jgi:hypothetical protein